jgi:hypothetical protein
MPKVLIGNIKGPKGDTGDRGERGLKGDSYVLTDADKENIAAQAKASLTKENWTFTLEDGSTVTKAVYVG